MKRAPLTKSGHERRVKRALAEMRLPPHEVRREGATVALVVNRLVTKPEGNQRASWRVVSTMRRAQHERVTMAMSAASVEWRPGPPSWVPRVVTLTRLSPGTLDDDNAVSSMKGVRDAVAKWFGVDDGPKGPITWRYGQRKRSVPGVEITLEWKEPEAMTEPDDKTISPDDATPAKTPLSVATAAARRLLRSARVFLDKADVELAHKGGPDVSEALEAARCAGLDVEAMREELAPFKSIRRGAP